MTPALVMLNRVLPLASTGIVVAVGVWQAFVAFAPAPDFSPLNVPELALQSPRLRDVAWPERNVFSEDGGHWKLPAEQASTKVVHASAAGKVHGVVKLPNGPKGVLVDKRLVVIGQPLGGGTLKDIREGSYVVEVEGVERVYPLDSGRQGRIDSLLGKR